MYQPYRLLIALLVGIMLIVLSACSQARQASPATAPDNQVRGRAIKVAQDELTVRTVDQGDVVLHISPYTNVWKGLASQTLPLKTDDFIIAVGSHRPDGSYDAIHVYSNITNIMGPISNLKQTANTTEFNLKDGRLGTYHVVVNDQALIPEGYVIQENRWLQIIGVEVDNRTVVATNILPYNDR